MLKWTHYRLAAIDICTEILYDMPMGLSAALYARVSTSDQNCEVQLHELRDYVERRGWTVHKEYVDSGFSGAKASRPAFDHLMRDAAQHRFSAVLVYKLDRFGLSVLNLHQALATLDANGIRFIAVSQGVDTDASNPTSRLLLNILWSVAAFELELIKERTLLGVRAAKANGKVLGRPKRVFRRDEVVRLRDQEGLSWRAIAKSLKIPVMTAVDAYRSSTEIVPLENFVPAGKPKRKKSAA
jgi:putative DNA-invertase from lambdoid prophage Rac